MALRRKDHPMRRDEGVADPATISSARAIPARRLCRGDSALVGRAMAKLRADQMLVDSGLAESRTRAQALIMAGLVFAGERKIDKAGQTLPDDVVLEVRGRDAPRVSRGEIKLAHGLDHFGWDVTGAVAIDVG